MPSHSHEEEDKPCRACSDFKSWAKMQNKTKMTSPNKPFYVPVNSADAFGTFLDLYTNGYTYSLNSQPPEHKDCPLDKEELGRSTWGVLHSMASYFPDKPNNLQSADMTKFFNIFAQFYPCEPCALDFQEDIKKNPPKTKSKDELAKWLCERHNTVNVKLGKPVFDCSKVHERWRDGWLDGSCD